MDTMRPWDRFTIVCCARCSGDHEDMKFMKFDRPIVFGRVTYEWWGICPTSGDPVLLRVQEMV